MITGLDHIAIAVPNLEQAITRFCEDFGLSFEGKEDIEAGKTSTAFFPINAEKTNIELVHPLNGEGPVQKFLNEKGGGLHHICFITDDMYNDVERLKAKGYQFIFESPQTGAHGKLVQFIHPKSTDGLLIELSQPSSN